MADFFTHPAVVGLVIAFPSLLLGYFGYRISTRTDATAARTSKLSIRAQEVQQVIDGLNVLAKNLQEDNVALRAHVTRLDEKLERVIAECERLKQQLAVLA